MPRATILASKRKVGNRCLGRSGSEFNKPPSFMAPILAETMTVAIVCRGDSIFQTNSDAA
jgi:hypothetical protein